jgi:hypothetical protein
MRQRRHSPTFLKSRIFFAGRLDGDARLENVHEIRRYAHALPRTFPRFTHANVMSLRSSGKSFGVDTDSHCKRR